MGWVIILACGVILIISMGLSLIEQVKEVLKGIKLLKKLLSKPAKNKRRKLRTDPRSVTTEHQEMIAVDQSHFESLNRTQLEVGKDSPPSSAMTGNL